MVTKLEAAKLARRAGADVIIAHGSDAEVLLRIAAGDQVVASIPADWDSPRESKTFYPGWSSGDWCLAYRPGCF